MKRVLAFSCHPDDAEFQAAGTLALLADKGWEIHMATVTGGEVGSKEKNHQEIRDVRIKEAAASAEVLNGKYHFAGGFDLEVEYNSQYRKMVTRVVRDVNPHIILTLPPEDYLIDHEEASRLVRNAAFIASVPSFDCDVPTVPMEGIPHLYYWSPIGLKDILGNHLRPHFGVDVSSVMETKEKMLSCHASQRDWLYFINKWDAYIENMIGETKKQGSLIGREYGECFLQHLGNGHPTNNLLGEVLKEYTLDIRGVS